MNIQDIKCPYCNSNLLYQNLNDKQIYKCANLQCISNDHIYSKAKLALEIISNRKDKLYFITFKTCCFKYEDNKFFIYNTPLHISYNKFTLHSEYTNSYTISFNSLEEFVAYCIKLLNLKTFI